MTGRAAEPPHYRKSGCIRELYSEIEIQSPPERIWEILADFPKYVDWNPFIRCISGSLAEGEQITADLRQSGTAGMRIRPVLVKVVPFRELRWRGHLFVRGLFDGEHVFEIRPLRKDTCLFVQHEYFSGLLLPLLEKMIRTDTARGFAEMNEALRARAEHSSVPLS